MNKDQLIDFDLPIIITTVKRYTKFSITKINIPFGQDAEVEIRIYDSNLNYFYENITIPSTLYSSWKYDEETITDFVKNYIQEMYHTWDGGS